MLRILATIRCQTIARQGFRRQCAVGWYLLRKDARRAVSAHLSFLHL